MNIPVFLLLALFSLASPKTATVSAPVPVAESEELSVVGTMRFYAPEDNSTMVIDKYIEGKKKDVTVMLGFDYQVNGSIYTSHLKGLLVDLCVARQANQDDYLITYNVNDDGAKYQGFRTCRIPATYAKEIYKYAKTKEGERCVLLSTLSQFEEWWGKESMQKAPPIIDEVHYEMFWDGRKVYITPPSESPRYKKR